MKLDICHKTLLNIILSSGCPTCKGIYYHFWKDNTLNDDELSRIKEIYRERSIHKKHKIEITTNPK